MKILIVEDNPSNAESFAEVFRLIGHETATICAKGCSLTCTPGNFRPDKILMDASMPEDILRDVLKKYRVPPVGITASSPHGKLPADIPVLQKPIEADRVLDALEHASAIPDPESAMVSVERCSS